MREKRAKSGVHEPPEMKEPMASEMAAPIVSAASGGGVWVRARSQPVRTVSVTTSGGSASKKRARMAE